MLDAPCRWRLDSHGSTWLRLISWRSAGKMRSLTSIVLLRILIEGFLIYRRVPYIWSVFWYYFFLITVKITENFRVENIWCRSKSPFPPRNGRFQTPNAAEARNSCATYIADHVRTELILKIIEESWVGLRWYSREVQKWPYFGLFWKKRETPESKCMALDGTVNSVAVWHSQPPSCAEPGVGITVW